MIVKIIYLDINQPYIQLINIYNIFYNTVRRMVNDEETIQSNNLSISQANQSIKKIVVQEIGITSILSNVTHSSLMHKCLHTSFILI